MGLCNDHIQPGKDGAICVPRKWQVLPDGIHSEPLEFGVSPAPSEWNQLPAQSAFPVSTCRQVCKKVEFTPGGMYL